MEKDNARNREIIRYNVIGIAMNLFLSATKFIIGTLSHSYAVVLDGFNSLTDLISAIFIIIFARLAQRKEDEHHPFGYGRLEYICSILITVLIIFIGGRSIIEAIDNIIHPKEAPNYTLVVVAIMVISMVCKYFYGSATTKKGRELNSESMIMAGEDNMGDFWVAISVLLSIVVYRMTGAVIENFFCVIISALIIRTGVTMLMDALTKILGTPVDAEYRKKISRLIAMEEGVYNVSSLVIHNYGESRIIGSADIEVGENMKASEIAALTRRLKRKVKEEGLVLTSVGISGIHSDSPEADLIWDRIIEIALKEEGVDRIQAFTVDFRNQKITFEVVFDYGVEDKEKKLEEIKEEVRKLYPKMKIGISSAIKS